MLVVDANVIVSCLVNKGVAFDVFLLNSIFEKFEFVAPEFLLVEIEKHREELYKETKLSRDEFDELVEFLTGEITVIPSSHFLEFLPQARKLLAEHSKDAPYVALALRLNCPIFSGDKVLKQLSPVKVLSPREVLELL